MQLTAEQIATLQKVGSASPKTADKKTAFWFGKSYSFDKPEQIAVVELYASLLGVNYKEVGGAEMHERTLQLLRDTLLQNNDLQAEIVRLQNVCKEHKVSYEKPKEEAKK